MSEKLKNGIDISIRRSSSWIIDQNMQTYCIDQKLKNHLAY